MAKTPFRRVCVMGLGHIGLPTAAMFASRKINVIGVDINQHTVDTVNQGRVHIAEPDLDLVVRAVVKEGYLLATTMPAPAEAFLIAVPTPFRPGDHAPDLTFIKAAAAAIAPVLVKGNLVVLESTAPVGTTEAMAAWLAEARPDLSFPQDFGETSDIRIAHCPERVLPGKVMQELITNDRVIGGMTRKCSELAARLYGTFVTGSCVIAKSPRLAEMAKLTENSFRDVNIAFANELSLICDKLDIDVWALIALANRHPRVNILQPGPGVGGHCIAVDPWFIVSSAPDQAKLIRAARSVNVAKPNWVIEKIRTTIGGHLLENPDKCAADVKVAIYGLAYKPNIDDLRESPALAIAQRPSQELVGNLQIVEPHIDALPDLPGAAMLCPFDAVDADIHVLLVDHAAFKRLPRPQGHVIDIRGIWHQ